jgi:hypothetical protein
VASTIVRFCDNRLSHLNPPSGASRTCVRNQRRTINGATEFCDYSCRAICVPADASPSPTAATCRLPGHPMAAAACHRVRQRNLVNHPRSSRCPTGSPGATIMSPSSRRGLFMPSISPSRVVGGLESHAGTRHGFSAHPSPPPCTDPEPPRWDAVVRTRVLPPPPPDSPGHRPGGSLRRADAVPGSPAGQRTGSNRERNGQPPLDRGPRDEANTCPPSAYETDVRRRPGRLQTDLACSRCLRCRSRGLPADLDGSSG